MSDQHPHGRLRVPSLHREMPVPSLTPQQRLVQRQYAQAVSGPSDVSASDLWDRSEWNRIKAETGSYPFGPQRDGGFIDPPTYAGCPDWAFELMGRRRPPVEVQKGADLGGHGL